MTAAGRPPSFYPISMVFKALLFLGAGSVIHAMSDEQDMRKMGGIWKKIPVTYAMMWIGSLALAGVPLFAGYYSKDLILESEWASGSKVGHFAYYMGIAAALIRVLQLAFADYDLPWQATGRSSYDGACA